jgi:hypothetical protein
MDSTPYYTNLKKLNFTQKMLVHNSCRINRPTMSCCKANNDALCAVYKSYVSAMVVYGGTIEVKYNSGNI